MDIKLRYKTIHDYFKRNDIVFSPPEDMDGNAGRCWGNRYIEIDETLEGDSKLITIINMFLYWQCGSKNAVDTICECCPEDDINIELIDDLCDNCPKKSEFDELAKQIYENKPYLVEYLQRKLEKQPNQSRLF